MTTLFTHHGCNNLGILKKVTNASAINENLAVFTANIKKNTANDFLMLGVGGSITFFIKVQQQMNFFRGRRTFTANIKKTTVYKYVKIGGL